MRATLIPFCLLVSLVAGDAVRFRSSEYIVGGLVFEDNFDHGMKNWSVELERPGIVEAKAGHLTVDVPAGATIWFRQRLNMPVLIQYEATAIQAGGANDRVSDLNCFWMATDSRSPHDFFAVPRSGAFADYDQLKTYYVGQGGNGNSTTRLRRYIGERNSRPLLREHDLSGAPYLLHPNVTQTIDLAATESRIEYLSGGSVIFDFHDSDPYRTGYFAFRTTFSHIQFGRFRVYSLTRKPYR